MLRLAIFPSFGTNDVPEVIEKDLVTGKNVRLEIARVACSFPVVTEITEEVLVEKTKNGGIIRFVDGSKEYLYFSNKTGFNHIEIVNVDTSKQWRINEYDGAESIEYFKGVTVVDKELNMCEW